MKDYANVGSKEQGQLEDISISLDADNIAAAEKAAREAIGKKDGNTVLVAWWDGKRNTGGPLEACSHDKAGCSRDFATSHGASTLVRVNDGLYQFFYGQIPPGHEALIKDQVIELHRGLGQKNVMGSSVGG